MPNVGDPAPQFSAKDVITGQTYTLSDYTGQVVLLIFSGPSWCPPCKFEAPVLQDLWNLFANVTCKPRTQFLMVSVDETEQSYKTAVQKFGLTFPALFDSGKILNLYFPGGAYAVPTLFVVDEAQKICSIHGGAGPPADALSEKIYSLLLGCGACDETTSLKIDMTRWVAAVMILFGVVQDAGGVVIPLPGGRPIPIDPWGPLRRMSAEKKNVLMSLAIAEMTKSLTDVKTAAEMELSALRAAEASLRKLVATASEKPLTLDKLFSSASDKK